MSQFFNSTLNQADPKIFESIGKEFLRQEDGLEMIASENYVSRPVMEAQGSVLTNKYAEGYPKKRYYGGCEFVDEVESLAIERACELFGAEAANVQPHSGSQANMAAYLALARPGDKIMGMDLSQGGHLTHGSPVNFSGKLFEVVSYGVTADSHRIDYDQVREAALREQPRILIAGASAYPRVIDFAKFGEIAKECGADLVVDMAHIAGLVAAGEHPSPIGHATYTTTTTHKTLRGPRGGLILCNSDRLKKVNSQIFPGIQGGPLMHVIAAKAVAFGEALLPEFKEYQKQVVLNAKALAEGLLENGFQLVSGGTDNHLVLLDLTQFKDGSTTGKDAENWLDQAHITVNKNTIPNEQRSPFVTSGLRIGVPALTTRKMKEPQMKQISNWIAEVVGNQGNEETLKAVKKKVMELCQEFPLYRV